MEDFNQLSYQQKMLANGWVTLESGQHVFIGDDGGFRPGGPPSGQISEKSEKGIDSSSQGGKISSVTETKPSEGKAMTQESDGLHQPKEITGKVYATSELPLWKRANLNAAGKTVGRMPKESKDESDPNTWLAKISFGNHDRIQPDKGSVLTIAGKDGVERFWHIVGVGKDVSYGDRDSGQRIDRYLRVTKISPNTPALKEKLEQSKKESESHKQRVESFIDG